jgi:hypothetical protein
MFLEATSEIASRITTAIRDAARATGASFDYLLRTAQRESNLDPSAKAPTSSASGLFQFTDQTWLETLKTSGPALGYGKYADSIVQTASGQFSVPDPAKRQAVMQLRNDPAAASAMAGALTKRNAATLAERIGRPPSEGELYAAHFLGAGGAVQLIAMNAAAPQTRAADAFPAAARANPAIFYDAHGSARSAAQVYALLTAPAGGPNAAAPAGATTPAAPAAPLTVASATAPDAIETNRNQYAGESGEVFHNLFRTERNGPVSPFVSQLWGGGPAQYPVQLDSHAAAMSPAASVAGTGPLDLHDFQRPGIPSVGSTS